MFISRPTQPLVCSCSSIYGQAGIQTQVVGAQVCFTSLHDPAAGFNNWEEWVELKKLLTTKVSLSLIEGAETSSSEFLIFSAYFLNAGSHHKSTKARFHRGTAFTFLLRRRSPRAPRCRCSSCCRRWRSGNWFFIVLSFTSWLNRWIFEPLTSLVVTFWLCNESTLVVA